MRTNAELRAEAWTLLKRHWKQLFAMMILITIVGEAVSFISRFLVPEEGLLRQGLSGLLSILVSPLCVMGIRYANLKAWSKEGVGVSAVFAYCAPAKRWASAMVPGVCLQVMILGVQALMLFTSLFVIGNAGNAAPILAVMFAVLFVGVALWVFLRLLLMDFVFIEEETPSPFVLIGLSWRFMKGEVGKAFGLMLSVCLLPLVLLFALPRVFSSVDQLVYAVMMRALLVPVMMYYNLVIAGFALDRMPALRQKVLAKRSAGEQA